MESGNANTYHKAIKSLPTTCSLAQPNVTVLMLELETCLQASSWTNLLAFAINRVNMNFIQHYRQK
jgi:hypothetical protein